MNATDIIALTDFQAGTKLFLRVPDGEQPTLLGVEGKGSPRC